MSSSSRRRLVQGFQSTLNTIAELPLGSSSSSPSPHHNSHNHPGGDGKGGETFSTTTTTTSTTTIILDGISRIMWTKYIQCQQGIPRRTRFLLVLAATSLAILIIVDRATTATTSSSKWARMMYENENRNGDARTTGGSRSSTNDRNSITIRGGGGAAVAGGAPGGVGDTGIIRDLHLAFVGDSVTRYMYLDLVYYLQHHRWVQDDDSPNILNAKHYPSWNDHYNASNRALAPNEDCDCFRNNPDNSSHIDKEETIENRYYAHRERNNYVTFIEIFGGYPPHGHWRAEDVYNDHDANDSNEEHRPIKTMDFEKLQSDPFVWRHDWPGLIRNYLHRLTPRPNYLVLNEGLWVEHELGNGEVRQSIKDALDDAGIIGIYKTTTLPNINSGLAKRSAGVVFNRHDDAMCQLIGNCLDLTWTKDLGDDHYWDGVHFKPHVNRGMNMELLDFLNHLQRQQQQQEKTTTTESPKAAAAAMIAPAAPAVEETEQQQ